ncbi:hypothetical protein ABL78_7601, partial [Leptomonas seymouri]
MFLLQCGDVESNPGPLTVVQANVNGLSKAKQTALLAAEADLYLLQEVKLSPNLANTWKVPGYTTYLCARTSRGGGTAIFVRQKEHVQSRRIPWKPRDGDSSVEGITVEVIWRDLTLRIGVVYMPPPASVTASLHRFMDTLRGYPSIFCGDINLQHPSWWTSAEQSDDADRFVALMEDSGFVLENVPDTPTYYQRTTHSALDVTWSRNITIENWCANPTVDSDHKYLTYAITLVRGVLITPSIPTFSRLFYSWKRANWGHFSAEVLKALKPLGPMSLDAYLMQFTSALRCATKRSCPHGCRTKGVTRWSHEMDTADKAAVTAQEAYFATPNAETLRTYQMCKDARARIIREALKDTWHRRISKADPGSSAPWSMLRAVRAAPTIPLVNQALSSSDGQTADTHRRKLRLLAKALFHRPTNPTAPSHFHHSRLLFFPFKAMLTPESLPSPSSSFSSFFTARSADTQGPPASTSSSSFFSCEDIPGAYALSFLSFPPEYDAIANWMATNRVVGIDSPFTMAEMDAALARLEDSRSAGPDGILNEMLHHLPREAKVHLLTLINWM